MAQWIARLTSNQKVAGSSPALGGSFYYKARITQLVRVPVLYTGSRGFEPHYGYLFGYRSQSSVSSVG